LFEAEKTVDEQKQPLVLDDFGRDALLGCMFLVDAPDFHQTEFPFGPASRPGIRF
jgi:hypothetical protein